MNITYISMVSSGCTTLLNIVCPVIEVFRKIFQKFCVNVSKSMIKRIRLLWDVDLQLWFVRKGVSRHVKARGIVQWFSWWLSDLFKCRRWFIPSPTATTTKTHTNKISWNYGWNDKYTHLRTPQRQEAVYLSLFLSITSRIVNICCLLPPCLSLSLSLPPSFPPKKREN